MYNLILICGGASPEHEISIRSTKNILSALDRDKYHINVIGISKLGKWILLDENELGEVVPETGNEVQLQPGNSVCFVGENLSPGKTDVIFSVLHGPNGEDGSIQGIFQLLTIPFVGSGVLGSALAMDKDVSKQLLSYNGIKVVDWMTLRIEDKVPSYSEVTKKLGEIVFVKPANMGSSVGVKRVANKDEFEEAIKDAFLFDRKILIEKCLIGRELECAVIGNENPEASGVGEVKSGEVYSYKEKYADNSIAKILIPADVSETELKNMRDIAINSYKILHCEGLARIDMFLDESGKVFVNEVNTMPGFTSISMYPKLWEHEGVSYTQLLNKLIDLALSKK